CADIGAVLDRFRAEVLAPLPGGNDDVDRAGGGEDAERVEAAIDERAEVALVEVIGGDGVDAGLLEFLGREGDLHPINLATIVLAADVIVEAEDGGTLVARVVAADALEEAGTVVDGVGQHVDLRVCEVDEPSVHPDLLDFFERHWGASWFGGLLLWTGTFEPELRMAGV